MSDREIGRGRGKERDREREIQKEKEGRHRPSRKKRAIELERKGIDGGRMW